MINFRSTTGTEAIIANNGSGSEWWWRATGGSTLQALFADSNTTTGGIDHVVPGGNHRLDTVQAAVLKTVVKNEKVRFVLKVLNGEHSSLIPVRAFNHRYIMKPGGDEKRLIANVTGIVLLANEHRTPKPAAVSSCKHTRPQAPRSCLSGNSYNCRGFSSASSGYIANT